MLLRRLSLGRLKVRRDYPPLLFLSLHLQRIPLHLQLNDFVADDAAEVLLDVHVKAVHRAHYKDIAWLTLQRLIEGTKRRLLKGKSVIWMWSSPYLSTLSLSQQGCLLWELCCATVKRAEKEGLDLNVLESAFDLLYLASGVPVCVHLQLCQDLTADPICCESFRARRERTARARDE